MRSHTMTQTEKMIRNVVRPIKTKVSLFYNQVLLKIFFKAPIVRSIDETLDKVINDKCSVSRFGDGEMLALTMHYNLGFQTLNKELSNRLKEIIFSNEKNMLVALPAIFESLNELNQKTSDYWNKYLKHNRYKWYLNVDKRKIYYNSFMTRPYEPFENKSNSERWFNKLKQIWNGRDIVIVEGEKSRLGMGNDLFDNSKSIKRILGPAENAFDKYQELLNEVKKFDKDKLVLIALGPTATVLAYDLHKLGYQAIDIGHVDIEYEWFLRKATEKVKIEYKYVNEVDGGKKVEKVVDESYMSQIMAKVV